MSMRSNGSLWMQRQTAGDLALPDRDRQLAEALRRDDDAFNVGGKKRSSRAAFLIRCLVAISHAEAALTNISLPGSAMAFARPGRHRRPRRATRSAHACRGAAARLFRSGACTMRRVLLAASVRRTPGRWRSCLATLPGDALRLRGNRDELGDRACVPRAMMISSPASARAIKSRQIASSRHVSIRFHSLSQSSYLVN